jgi:hypothetical protein
MEYDFAIIYFGLTRSIKKTHETHKKYVYDVLKKNNITYQIFMHTWKTKDDTQNVWEEKIPEKIDYTEYKLLSPDYYSLDDQSEYLECINMDMYFYKDVWYEKGHASDGEWLPGMVSNHICMLESQKRGLSMVTSSGNKFKFIMFIRPDTMIHNELPIDSILANADKIHLPNNSHYSGKNDKFAIVKYEDAYFFGNRIDELPEFRMDHGRIVGEKY